MSLGHVRFRGRVSETAVGEDERDDDEFDEQEQRAAKLSRKQKIERRPKPTTKVAHSTKPTAHRYQKVRKGPMWFFFHAV